MIPSKTCCQKLPKTKWDGKTFNWSGKTFYFVTIPTFFYFPFRVRPKINHLLAKVDQKKYKLKKPIQILTWVGLFSGAALVAIQKPTKKDPSVFTFEKGSQVMAKVTEAPWKNLHKVVKEFIEELKAAGKSPQKLYFWYLTCPKCSQKIGYQTIIFARLR